MNLEPNERELNLIDENQYQESSPYFPLKDDYILSVSDAFNLVKNPPEFFKTGAVTKDRYITIALYLYGIQYAIEKVDDYILKEIHGVDATNHFASVAMNSWIMFWPTVIILGIFSSLGIWYLQGWWYNTRLNWCSNTHIDGNHGRAVFIFNKMIYVVPFLIITIIEMFLYSNHYEAFNSESAYSTLTALIPLILLIVSTVNSYKSVTHVFNLKRLHAKIWFLILPLMLYGVALIGLTLFLI